MNTKSVAVALAALSLSLGSALSAAAAPGPLADALEYVDQHTQAPIDILAGFKLGDQLAALPGPEAALWRVRVLGRALRGVDSETRQKKPIADWLEKHQDEVIFSEPSGENYLSRRKVWDLYEKSKDSPFAEEIAWEAAITPAGGECEGHLTCYLGDELDSIGRYLELYPRGKNKKEALDRLYWITEVQGDYPLDKAEVAEAKKLLDHWRKILAAVPGSEVSLQSLEEVARVYAIR